jgi:hypothetical protein
VELRPSSAAKANHSARDGQAFFLFFAEGSMKRLTFEEILKGSTQVSLLNEGVVDFSVDFVASIKHQISDVPPGDFELSDKQQAWLKDIWHKYAPTETKEVALKETVFEPSAPNVVIRRESGSWLNLWRGWGVVPERGKWPLLRGHVEEILCAGDPAVADYNLRWAAWSFQHPAEQAEAAVVFRGKKGAGKGLWLATLRVVFGPHGLQISQAEHLTGRFNHHLWTCVYVFADEAFWAGDKQGEAILKALITERPLMVEKKGVDTVQGRNLIKLGIASNSDWVVPATHDERRYAVTDVDNRYARGHASEEERKAYFGPIWRELAEGGAAAMLYDLLQMNLGDWHPREVPTTSGLMRQKKESLRGNYQWFEALLQAGFLPRNEKRPNRISTYHLLKFIKGFRGLDYATEESLSSFLYGEMGFIPALSPQGNRYRGSNGGPRGWEFPPLPDLRSRWETKFGGTWPWHEDLDEWQPGPGFEDLTVDEL